MHTAETLAQSAMEAVLPQAPSSLVGGAVHKLAALEYVVTATLEEWDDRSKEDLKFIMESLLVLASQ